MCLLRHAVIRYQQRLLSLEVDPPIPTHLTSESRGRVNVRHSYEFGVLARDDIKGTPTYWLPTGWTEYSREYFRKSEFKVAQ